MYFEIKVKPHEHAAWKRDWVSGDRPMMERLFRDIVVSRRVYAAKLQSVTPPPDYVAREVIEYWETK